MTISQEELKKIAGLAYLNTDSSDSNQLSQEISSIMDFIDQLRSVDTTNVMPLFHPFSSHQRLRTDEISEHNCTTELAAIAPLFEDNLYLVPKVIESSK
jgi:aspartyl-tRNA(Asn)/glutamyl-tRNA(Gln) amidotransferase subunit C